MYLFNNVSQVREVMSYTNAIGDKVYPIIVDIKRGIKSTDEVRFVSADINTGILSVAFVEGEDVYNIRGAEILCSIVRPDATVMELSCNVINDNVVEVPLGVGGTSQEGMYMFDFKVVKAQNRVIGTPIMSYTVSLSIDSGDSIVNDDRLPVLTSFITTLTNVKSQADAIITEGETVIAQSKFATSNAQSATAKAEDAVNRVNQAIAGGTQDLEVKSARVSSDGTTYTTLHERLCAMELSPYILFEEVEG